MYNALINSTSIKLPSVATEYAISKGYLVDYIDGLKAAGRLRQDYIYSDSAKTVSAAPAAPVAKTEFTVEDLEPYTAWATNDSNIRAGGDTTYDVIGGLKKHE